MLPVVGVVLMQLGLQSVELLQQLRMPRLFLRLGEFMGDPLRFAGQRGQVADRRSSDAPHRLRFVKFRVLFKIADGSRSWHLHGTAIGLKLVSQNLEQCGFARSVRPDQGDVIAVSQV